MYTVRNFKSKKALKEAVVERQEALANGGLASPVRYFQPGPFGGSEAQNGTITLEGPHFPEAHKWYATATVRDGEIVKVK